MCDYGVISGPLIASALYGTGAVATTAAASTAATAIATAASTAIIAGAGSAATAYGVSQQNKASADAANQANEQNYQLGQAERSRQQQFQDQKNAALNNSVDNNSASANQAEMDKEAQVLSKTYDDPAKAAATANIPGLTAGDVAATGNRVVNDTAKNDLGKISQYLTGQGNARAGMDAFTSTLLQQGQGNRDTANQLNLLNNFSQGSENLLGLEKGVVNQGAGYNMQKASQAGDTAATIGGLVSSLGTYGGLAASNNSVGTSDSIAKQLAKKKSTPTFAQLGQSAYLPR